MRPSRRTRGMLKANNPVKASEKAQGKAAGQRGRYRQLTAVPNSREMGVGAEPAERRVVLQPRCERYALAPPRVIPRPPRNKRPADGQHIDEVHQLAYVQAIASTNHVALSLYKKEMPWLADANIPRARKWWYKRS